MVVTTATSVLELNISSPSWVDDRATLCTPTLVHFDAVSGLLQYNTTCAGSRNSWIQTVLYEDWGSIITIREPQHDWGQGPLYPESDEQTDERAEVERLEEETTILGTESWPEVLSKFPELVNMDVKVHCNCPAFLWWGSWYNLDQRDDAIYQEGVPFPHERDPSLSNIICKHLAAVFANHF